MIEIPSNSFSINFIIFVTSKIIFTTQAGHLLHPPSYCTGLVNFTNTTSRFLWSHIWHYHEYHYGSYQCQYISILHYYYTQLGGELGGGATPCHQLPSLHPGVLPEKNTSRTQFSPLQKCHQNNSIKEAYPVPKPILQFLAFVHCPYSS